MVAVVKVSIEERLWRYISPEPNTGCWLWGGCLNEHGYGLLSIPTPKAVEHGERTRCFMR